MSEHVMVFAPAPRLTVTVERETEAAELHLHPGGQGIWQARMITTLGTAVTLCAALGGEVGSVLEQLIVAEGMNLRQVSRHASSGGRVVADLTGEYLTAVLEGGVCFLKISHEEVIGAGRATDASVGELTSALLRLRADGAETVMISRAGEPALALIADKVFEVQMPRLQEADPHGAGDSMTAGVAAVLARGGGMHQAVRTGAAAGALNVTRHGLGTGRADAIRELVAHVRLNPLRGATMGE